MLPRMIGHAAQTGLAMDLARDLAFDRKGGGKGVMDGFPLNSDVEDGSATQGTVVAELTASRGEEGRAVKDDIVAVFCFFAGQDGGAP